MRRLIALVFVLIALACGGLAIALLRKPADPVAGAREQLVRLEKAIATGAPAEMQRHFPEGRFFMHALYGLTAVQVGDPDAWSRASAALSALDSDDVRAQFPADSAFYLGWTTWFRALAYPFAPPAERAAFVKRLTADGDRLADLYAASGSPFLESYAGQAWPVDNVVAVAALAAYDCKVEARYGGIRERWLSLARREVEPASGLFYHMVGRNELRATSLTMLLAFLREIDPAFGEEMYASFHQRFVTKLWGLFPAVSEYPEGVEGHGDIDSGPLISGVSASASAVALAAARANNDAPLADALAAQGALTSPLLRVLPIGDAFFAWARTAGPVCAPPAPPRSEPVGLLASAVILGLAASAAFAAAVFLYR